jgi:hypothetical protein
MIKKIMIIAMMSSSGLQAMMCVQTLDMPVALPQAFIDASPVLQAMQKGCMDANLKKHGLFTDQASRVVQRVIEDQKILSSKGPAVGDIVVGYKGIACCIALARRLELAPLLAEYRTRIRSFIP